MGMGTYACHADTIEPTYVEKICIEEYKSLSKALAKSEDVDFDYMCRTIGTYCDTVEEEFGDEGKAIDEAYEALAKAFREKTGLSLGVTHHDPEDSVDELDGGTFTIENAYIRNPALDSLNASLKSEVDVVERKFWTTFG